MLVPKLAHNLLLLVAHLLLAGSLPGAYLWAMFQGPGARQYYLAVAGVGLALLLLVWVGTLLVRRLWQRRWVAAGGLALLLVTDVLALHGGLALLFIFGMAPGPN